MWSGPQIAGGGAYRPPPRRPASAGAFRQAKPPGARPKIGRPSSAAGRSAPALQAGRKLRKGTRPSQSPARTNLNDSLDPEALREQVWDLRLKLTEEQTKSTRAAVMAARLERECKQKEKHIIQLMEAASRDISDTAGFQSERATLARLKIKVKQLQAQLAGHTSCAKNSEA